MNTGSDEDELIRPSTPSRKRTQSLKRLASGSSLQSRSNSSNGNNRETLGKSAISTRKSIRNNAYVQTEKWRKDMLIQTETDDDDDEDDDADAEFYSGKSTTRSNRKRLIEAEEESDVEEYKLDGDGDVDVDVDNGDNDNDGDGDGDGDNEDSNSKSKVSGERKRLEIVVGLAPPPLLEKRGRGRPRKYPIITTSIPGFQTPARSSLLAALRRRQALAHFTDGIVGGYNVGFSRRRTVAASSSASVSHRAVRPETVIQPMTYKKIPLIEELAKLIDGVGNKSQLDTSKTRPELSDVVAFKDAARTVKENRSSVSAAIIKATIEDNPNPIHNSHGKGSNQQQSINSGTGSGGGGGALALGFVDDLAASSSSVSNHHNYQGGASIPPRIRKIFFGEWDIDTWYSAPYPEEYLSREGTLWICDHCFKYMNSSVTLKSHRSKCIHKHPPGDEIYRDGAISVFEVNGKLSKIFCQNLCLFAKMFLDHKTLYYDVEPFLFYVLTEWDENGCHFVGYFSKEKQSMSNYNVSCILTMPTSQRKGYGNFLIDFSYLLSKAEGRPGSPEKPLSELGFFSYRKYWTSTVRRVLVSNKKPNLSITDICDITMMTKDDVIMALEWLNALERNPENPEEYVLCVNRKVLSAQVSLEDGKPRLRAKPECLQWSPFKYPQY